MTDHAQGIADYYAGKAAEAHRLADELADARETLRSLRASRTASRRHRLQQESIIRELERRLDAARYTGD